MGPKKDTAVDIEAAVKLAVMQALQDKGMLATLAALVKDTIVSEMRKTLEENTRVISELKDALVEKDKTIGVLENKIDDLEQYQRRQCLRVFGVSETDGEDTDKLAIDVAKKIGVDLSVNDIDRSHRIGRKETDRPRPVIVKFVSYRKRNELFRSKKNLRGTGIVIREDLTKKRHALLQEAITKFGLKNVWTQDGAIIVKIGDTKRRVTQRADL